MAAENDSDVEDSVEGPVKFRVCILGHTGTGKTSLVNQFLTSEYMNAYDTSLGQLNSVLVVIRVKPLISCHTFFNPFPIHRTYFCFLPSQMVLLGFFHVLSPSNKLTMSSRRNEL